MRVTVAGLGRVGGSIAKRLSREDCEVTVIDSNPEIVADFSSHLDVRGVVGSAVDPNVLRRAKVDQSNMVIAVTDSDSDNIVMCQLAHSLFEVPTKIARIRSDEYYQRQNSSFFGDDNAPVDFALSPERLVARDAWHHLSFPSATTAYRLCDERIALFGFPITDQCVLTDLPLSQITAYYGNISAMVVAVEKNGELTIANGRTKLSAGDTVYVTVDSSDATRLMALFGFPEKHPTKILLAGGGRVGRYVARHIVDAGGIQWLRIIDRNTAHAHKVAAEFDDVMVLHGNILNPALLAEAGAGEAEVILSLTGDNRDNMISGVMAKDLGCEMAIALVHGSNFARLAPKLGLDGFIDPSIVTESAILRHLRRGRLIGVHAIAGGKAEVLEAVAMPSAPILNRELSSIEDLKGIRISNIFRDSEVIIPNAKTEIRAGDRIIIVAPSALANKVEKLLQVGVNYF